MKILMFGMSSYPGGIENYIANYFLCEEMAKEVSIDFVTYENTLAYKEKINDCKYNIKTIPHLKKHPLRYIRAVKKLLKENRYDCVYVNMLSAANIIPIKYASKYRVEKIVAHAHANSTVNGFLRNFLHRRNKKSCKKKANVRFACSKEAGEWLFDEEPYEIIPNAIDSVRFSFSAKNREEIRKKYGVLDDTFLIGHVGRFADEKNHTFLIDVLDSLKQTIKSPIKLMLVGDGADRGAIEEKVEHLGLKEEVVFVGTSNETEKYYSAFDCFVFPSIFEGFGMAALEAQVSGLTCFCANGLSNELDLFGRVKFLGLDIGANAWAEHIALEILKKTDRKDIKIPARFDINHQRGKMLEILQ